MPYYDNGYYGNDVYSPSSTGAYDQPPSAPFMYTYPPPDILTPQNETTAQQDNFVLYLKDGSIVAVTNYWLAGGQLHYTTNYGGENTINLDQLDLQKTVTVNATRGLNFTLRPSPILPGDEQNNGSLPPSATTPQSGESAQPAPPGPSAP
jgi:hypothetical protein